MSCSRCGVPHERCKGHNRAGRPCGLWPLAGQEVCGRHGGDSPQAKRKAAERIAEREAARVLTRIWNPNADPVTDSVSEMQRLAGALRQAVDVLGDQLDAGEPCEHCGRARADLDSVHAVAWVRVLRELRTLLAEMERLGIASRGLEITEALAAELSSAVRRVLDRLGLSEVQRGLVSVVVPEEIRRIAVELPGPVVAAGSESPRMRGESRNP